MCDEHSEMPAAKTLSMKALTIMCSISEEAEVG